MFSKKLISFTLILTFIFSIVLHSPAIAREDDIRVKLDGKYLNFDVPPVSIEGRVLVPLRAIFEALGAYVEWDGNTRKAFAIKRDTTIVLMVGSKAAYVSGKRNELSVPSQIINGRTLVPTRFIAESLGATVDWDGANRTVVITSKKDGGTAVSSDPKVPDGLKIGYLLPSLNNTYHWASSIWARLYAKDRYNADVTVYDGKSNTDTMSSNFYEAYNKGMDMVSTHIWQGESISSLAREAIDDGMVVTSFFDKIPGVPCPFVTINQKDPAERMGRIAAEQWKKANPDKPIVFACIGWPDNEFVKTQRTNPFVKGVLGVDSNATYLGCFDASQGAEAAYKVTESLIQSRPDLNIIYSEAVDLTVGVLPALQQHGRGKMNNGVPLTEILCSTDCPSIEIFNIFDPNCSLKMSLGLDPKTAAKVRVDTMMKVYTGEIKQLDTNAASIDVTDKLIGYWNMTADEAVDWYNEQYFDNISVPDYDNR